MFTVRSWQSEGIGWCARAGNNASARAAYPPHGATHPSSTHPSATTPPQRCADYHHSYKEPSAFAQFSVHPLESVLQGPFGHFFVQLFFPVHPIQLALMGFLSSAWAFAAHDGRGLDINSHFFHHSKGRGRKYYFNLGFRLYLNPARQSAPRAPVPLSSA